MSDTDDTDDWDPQPAKLREGETPDVSAHASGNIEQIRQAERDGDLSEEAADRAVERIKEGDDECDE